MRWTVAFISASICLVATLPAAEAAAGGSHPRGVVWHSCVLGPDDAEGAALDEAGIECGDVTVPLDYSHPRGRSITVAIARSRGADTTHRVGSMIINLGGPGNPVRGVIPDARAAMGETGERYDLIGMDPRFAGRSTPIDCGWTAHWLPRSAGADRAGFDAMVSLTRDLAARCGRTERALLPYASTANMARDMDTIRAALGEPKLSYLGYRVAGQCSALRGGGEGPRGRAARPERVLNRAVLLLDVLTHDT